MFDRYTDEQWEAIVAARAEWPRGSTGRRFERRLSGLGVVFGARARYARPSNMSPANFERYVAYTHTRKI
jgi:hypothetical protein